MYNCNKITSNFLINFKLFGRQKLQKNQKLLAYITKKFEKVTVTSLMKLSYLIDLVSIKKTKNKISNFEYRRYNHGPFDSKIYSVITKLIESGVLVEEADYTYLGMEFVQFKFNSDKDYSFDLLSKGETITIDEVSDSLKGYTARTLTDLAYKTKPMKKFGATHGGDEHLNELLDLYA